MSDTIRIFVGTEPKTHLAYKVLEHSIRRRTASRVEVTPMIGPAWEYPTKGITVGTGFSLRRWMIPAACGWKGRAIYLDADQLVFADIKDLWNMCGRDGGNSQSMYCTYQPDKFSEKPWPQTSVMVINCEAAQAQGGYWRISEILDRLRLKNEKRHYADFMHATWADPQPRQIPTEWNHLNVYSKGKTRLLHYTKEPEQPWYKPNHPLADLWEAELRDALATKVVTEDEIREALSKWDVKEDWRSTNGLHPHYKKLLAKEKIAAPAMPTYDVAKKRANANALRPLWVTSFAKDMYEASGKKLLQTFVTHGVPGTMFVGCEGFSPLPQFEKIHNASAKGSFVSYDVSADPWLQEWLTANADVIPQHLGGTHDGKCTCPGGPYDIHDKRHKLPCVGYWFDRNASRWFRKIVTQRRAVAYAKEHGHTNVIWLDSDCYFKRKLLLRNVHEWFKRAAFFYLKNKRPVLEAGVLGFDLAQGGEKILEGVVDCYGSGAFRKHARWDDCAVYQKFIDRGDVKTVDIATGVGEHAAVVQHSPLHLYLAHDKGLHGRKKGIMT